VRLFPWFAVFLVIAGATWKNELRAGFLHRISFFRRFVPGELTADYARDRAVYGTQSRKPVDSENVSNIDS
jgi:hypothetical protein